MPVDIEKTLREALSQLGSEKKRIERQIAAVQGALASMNGGRQQSPVRAPAARAKRAPVTAAARRAASERMKAYWAKRRAQQKKQIARGKSSSRAKKPK